MRLLELTGNLPLAVSLIASVASHEGCDAVLSRWKSERTQILSDGYEKRSSLDISIMLSFTSSRMTAGAQELLSILSMLPDGLSDTDLLQIDLPILNILACKATLIKTSLAFLDKDTRIKVLIPIREHIISTHPPTNVLKFQTRRFLHQVLDLWNNFQQNSAEIVTQITRNLGNLNSVLLSSLGSKCPDDIQNFQSVLILNTFYRRIYYTHTPLLLDLSEQMIDWYDHPIFGDYLIQCFESADDFPLMDAKKQIVVGNVYFQSKHPLEQGKKHEMLWFLL
jgi:hypothetical protein